MIIRNAGIKEIDQVMDFYGEVIDALEGLRNGPGWVKGVYPSYEFVKASIENKELYVADKGAEIAGAAILNYCSNEGFQKVLWKVDADLNETAIVHAFAVSPRYRGRGTGKAMLRELFRIRREKGDRVLRLDVLAENTPAVSLYESVGFRRVVKTRLSYHPIGEREFWMYEYEL